MADKITKESEVAVRVTLGARTSSHDFITDGNHAWSMTEYGAMNLIDAIKEAVYYLGEPASRIYFDPSARTVRAVMVKGDEIPRGEQLDRVAQRSED